MSTKNRVKIGIETYTTSELASPRGVTVGPTSVLVKKQSLKPVKAGQNNTGYYDASVLKQLRLRYVRSKSKYDRTNNTQDSGTQLIAAQLRSQLLRDQPESAESTIEVLRDGLKIKNSQINKLQDPTNQAQ